MSQSFILDRDTSDVGLRAELFQELVGGERVVTCLSCALSGPKKNYGVISTVSFKTFPAIPVWAIDHHTLFWLLSFKEPK